MRHDRRSPFEPGGNVTSGFSPGLPERASIPVTHPSTTGAQDALSDALLWLYQPFFVVVILCGQGAAQQSAKTGWTAP